MAVLYCCIFYQYIGGRTSRYTLTVDAEAAVDGNIVFNVESAGQYMRPGWKATGTFKITKTSKILIYILL